MAYVWHGQIDKTFEWLDRAHQKRDGGLTLLQAIVGFSDVRKDPRYEESLRKMNFPR